MSNVRRRENPLSAKIMPGLRQVCPQAGKKDRWRRRDRNRFHGTSLLDPVWHLRNGRHGALAGGRRVSSNPPRCVLLLGSLQVSVRVRCLRQEICLPRNSSVVARSDHTGHQSREVAFSSLQSSGKLQAYEVPSLSGSSFESGAFGRGRAKSTAPDA
jgi:hypothetical protein